MILVITHKRIPYYLPVICIVVNNQNNILFAHAGKIIENVAPSSGTPDA